MAAADHPFNVYLSWLIPVIMGQLQEADTIALHYPGVIDRFAAKLQKNTKILRPVYRGVLLDPATVQPVDPNDPQQGGLVQLTSRGEQSVSFSEDQDVACYFADPTSDMSSYYTQAHPNVRGYLIKLVPRRAEILWHYRWNPIPYKGQKYDIRVAARRHSATAHDPAQFDHVFGTQREMILKPFPPGTVLRVMPIDALSPDDACPDVDTLNQRFTPPHLRPFLP